MFNKRMIIDIVQNAKLTDAVCINYEGFEGRGANGNKNMVMYLANNFPNNVHTTKWSNGDEYITQLVKRWIENDYIKAKYIVFYRSNPDKEFREHKRYTRYVPYERITSIDVVERVN